MGREGYEVQGDILERQHEVVRNLWTADFVFWVLKTFGCANWINNKFKEELNINIWLKNKKETGWHNYISFIRNLFYNNVCVSDYIIWKVYENKCWNVQDVELSWCVLVWVHCNFLIEKLEKTTHNVSQDNRCLGRDSNPETSECVINATIWANLLGAGSIRLSQLKAKPLIGQEGPIDPYLLTYLLHGAESFLSSYLVRS